MGIAAPPESAIVRVVVYDSSVLFKLVVDEPDSGQAQALVNSARIIVPKFMFLEVGNALWSRVQRGQLDLRQAKRLLDRIREFRFETLQVAPFVDRSLELASLLSHPIYDCLYIAVAEFAAVPLVTADKRFVAAVNRGKLRIAEVIELADFVL